MIQLATGFEVLTSLPLDSRSLMTKAQMLTVNDNVFPDFFLTQCIDENGKLYLYSKNNEYPSVETGKFTPLEDYFGSKTQVEELPVAGEDEFGKIYQYIGETKEEDNLIKACWYICVGSAEDGYSWENILVEPELVLDEITNNGDPEFIEGSLKTIVLKQGTKVIGKFGIDKELVVTNGKVEKIEVNKVDEGNPETWIYTIKDTDPEETYTKADTENEESDYYKYPLIASTYIVLGITNQSYPIFIDVTSMMAKGSPITTEDITANCEVGGIAIGDTISEGSDLTEVVKKLLVKYFAPTITLTATPTNKVVEIGTSIHVDLSAAAAKKTNDITKVAFYKGADVLEEITENVAAGGTFTHSVVNNIDTTTTFKATATDGKKVTESKITYTFVHPFYTGVVADKSSIDITSLTKKVEEKGKKTISYKANNEYVVFAYDASYGNLTSILDPSSFENLGSFTKTTELVNGTNYNVYVSNSPLTNSTGFEYRFIF